MERIKSWFYRDNIPDKVPKENQLQESDSNDVRNDQLSVSRNPPTLPMDVQVDPKVAECFKDFPEPYKTKAITRFSSRTGLYRWDLFRDSDMKVYSAIGGIFLKDKREERKESVANMKETDHIQIEEEMVHEEKLDTEMPKWERALRARIPVQKNETLGWKLGQTAYFSLGGVVLLWAGITSNLQRPNYSKLRLYTAIAGSFYLFGYCEVVAVYRLMDWGPFDRSVDDRPAVTKKFEEFEMFFTTLKEAALGKNSSDSESEEGQNKS